MEMKGRKYRRNVMFGLALAFMLFWLVLGITATAMARMEQEENNQLYLVQEKILIKNVRNYLASKGYQNSGVTLSRTIRSDGSVEYKVTMHHGKINDLDEKGQKALLEELSQIRFEEDDAPFTYVFLQ